MAEKLHIGDTVDMIGARFAMVASMGAGEQDTFLFRTGMAPGRLVPLHSHIDPECFYVLEGRIEVLVLDDAPGWRPAGAGQSLLVANGVKHAVRNTTETAADLILATNNRFSDFLATAGLLVPQDSVPMAPPSPERIQRMLNAAHSWGYWVAPPDESASVVSQYTGDMRG